MNIIIGNSELATIISSFQKNFNRHQSTVLRINETNGYLTIFQNLFHYIIWFE